MFFLLLNINYCLKEPTRVSVDDLAAKQPSPTPTISVPPRPSDVRVRPRRLILTPIMKPLPSRGVDFVHSTEVIDLTDPKPELESTPLGDTTNVTIHTSTVGGPSTRLRAKMRAHTTTRPDWAVAPAAEDVKQTQANGPVAKSTVGEGKVRSNRAIRRGKKRPTIEASENYVATKGEKTEATSNATVEVKSKGTRATGKGRGEEKHGLEDSALPCLLSGTNETKRRP
ncbi:hypothetical protein BC629DRAFT_117268 [Irpex lacteus]|nr:hypothetical protein BC629DRAFT_117268 [Irpex lacteus]